MAHCYLKLQEYDYGLKTVKKMLQIAWVYEIHTAETICYELMSKCYFYKGELRKCAYYNQRYLRGVSEADFSRVRKAAVLQSKDLPNAIKSPHKAFKNVKDLFTPTIKDYQMSRPEIIA